MQQNGAEIKGQISLTPKAIQYLQKSLAGKDNVLGIRLGVKPSGCSGLSYVMDFAKEINKEDKVFESLGIKIIVDPNSFPILQGMEIDCIQEGLTEMLQFNNPNVKSSCGCGESFNIEK